MREESLTAVAEAIRARTLSPVEAVERCLERVRKWDGRIRAFIRLVEEGALGSARVLETEAAAGRWRGPLHGVPVGFKDLCHLRGLPTSCGTGLPEYFTSAQERTAARRLLIARAESSALHAGLLREHPEALQPTARARVEVGLGVPAYDYLQALRLRAKLTCAFIREVFGEVDVLLVPVIPEPAPALASLKAATVEEFNARSGRFPSDRAALRRGAPAEATSPARETGRVASGGRLRDRRSGPFPSARSPQGCDSRRVGWRSRPRSRPPDDRPRPSRVLHARE